NEVTARQVREFQTQGEHQGALARSGELPSLSEALCSLGEHSSVQDESQENKSFVSGSNEETLKNSPK
ncbi:hypothetical protein A2U01_0104027, partial [Trifolium medium]|nr:hypothetical protein [Trifolium medium]